MKHKLKSLLTFILGFLAFLSFLGTGGSLELDIITVQQALIQWAALFTTVIVGVVMAAIKQRREE